MKTLRTLLAIAILSGCAAKEDEEKEDDGLSAETSEDSGEIETVAYAFPNGAGTWTGENDSVIPDIPLKKGAAVLEILNKYAESNIIVELNDDAGQMVDVVFNKIGAYHGENVIEIPEDGNYSLEIKSDGEWVITSVVPDPKESYPDELTGISAEVSKAFKFKADVTYTVSATHQGDSNFAVRMVDANTGELKDLPFNEIGIYAGQAQITLNDTGYYLIDTEANGEWKLTFTK